MLSGKRVLAVIPARGGSKRLPKKNLLDLAGKPLVAWSIEAAQKSRYVDTIVVSSDDEELLELARTMGVIALKRPAELASDTASSFDAVSHAITHHLGHECTLLLQPTSPLRNARHIDEALEMYIEKEALGVISVCEMEHSPLWANELPENLSLDGFLREEILHKRSQELPRHYRLNGAIYITDTAELLKEREFFLKKRLYAYVMDRLHSIDIDEKIDFLLAKTIIESLQEE